MASSCQGAFHQQGEPHTARGGSPVAMAVVVAMAGMMRPAISLAWRQGEGGGGGAGKAVGETASW